MTAPKTAEGFARIATRSTAYTKIRGPISGNRGVLNVQMKEKQMKNLSELKINKKCSKCGKLYERLTENAAWSDLGVFWNCDVQNCGGTLFLKMIDVDTALKIAHHLDKKWHQGGMK